MGKTKDLRAFERGMVVGDRGTGLWFKNCNAAGFFTLNSFPCVSRMVHYPKDSANLTNVGSIGVLGECGMLSTPCRVHFPRN